MICCSGVFCEWYTEPSNLQMLWLYSIPGGNFSTKFIHFCFHLWCWFQCGHGVLPIALRIIFQHDLVWLFENLANSKFSLQVWQIGFLSNTCCWALSMCCWIRFLVGCVLNHISLECGFTIDARRTSEPVSRALWCQCTGRINESWLTSSKIVMLNLQWHVIEVTHSVIWV